MAFFATLWKRIMMYTLFPFFDKKKFLIQDTISAKPNVLIYHSRFRALVPGVLAKGKWVNVQLSKLKVIGSVCKNNGKCMITCYCLNWKTDAVVRRYSVKQLFLKSCKQETTDDDCIKKGRVDALEWRKTRQIASQTAHIDG